MRTSSPPRQVYYSPLLLILPAHTATRPGIPPVLPDDSQAYLPPTPPRFCAHISRTLPTDPAPTRGTSLQLPLRAFPGLWARVRASGSQGHQRRSKYSRWRWRALGTMDGDGYPRRVITCTSIPEYFPYSPWIHSYLRSYHILDTRYYSSLIS